VRAAALPLLMLAAACGPNAGPAATTGEASRASAAPAVVVEAPKSLARTTTPEARRERDEKACGSGDAAACRRTADRYRGYGHVAGCGVVRDRPKPRRSVTAADARDDAKLFDTWIRRACELGDDDACVQGRNNVFGQKISDGEVDACARSGLADCPAFQWRVALHPDDEKVLVEKRRAFVSRAFVTKFFGTMFARAKQRGGDTLPKEVFAAAERVCKATLECDDVLTLLDEDGYTPAALAPLRKAMGQALAAQCLEGDCVCGEAARLLAPDDARREDLARIGCDDGEPDGCFVLGQLAEPNAMEKAALLYDIACPAVIADDGREEIYSKPACDRLGQMYEEGKGFEKDSDRAFYYASLACTRVEREQDHGACVRRALLHARGYWRSNLFGKTPRMLAKIYFYGDDEPAEGHECERPSVAELCKTNEKAVLSSTYR
jgi:TPR repeat protein